ncbi:hypothetical protein B0H19DRAFT_1008804 [Mycena capillaripes]|nr:hypothetical protein B0H19DRAFT_1008804 [Mycena capillaripes]
MTPSILFILSFLSAARAANDWNKPCLSGVCSYDLPSTNGSTSSGSMKIWGSQTAIGDITEAAGWKILGCSPDALSQDIRLVCAGDETMCQHLYSGHGAADTIVRLPEDCGKSPFARVQKAWVPADQSIPASIAARLVRRDDGSQPQVQAITLDTNFAAADNAKTGAVNLAVQGVNVPGLNDALNSATAPSQRRSRLNQRQLKSFVADAANSISNAISNVNNVSINKSKALPAADFSKKVSLFEKKLECPPISAEASVDVDATAHAVVTIGVAATGTIVPPKITDFSLLASLTADLNGELTLKAELSGTLDSGNIKLFETGIPGLDFPGILTVGPSFQVNARGTATAEVAADLTLGINYHVDKAQMSFPDGKQSGGSFSLGDTPLKLSADAKVEATTTVEAHLIPSINFGLSALDVATANVALSLDASASMVLKVEAKAGASATVQQANSKRQDDFDDGDFDDSSDGAGDDSDGDEADDSSDGSDLDFSGADNDSGDDTSFDAGDESDFSGEDTGDTSNDDSGLESSGENSDDADLSGDGQDADAGSAGEDGDDADLSEDGQDADAGSAGEDSDDADLSEDGQDADAGSDDASSDDLSAGDDDNSNPDSDESADSSDSSDSTTDSSDSQDQDVADTDDSDENGLDSANNSTSSTDTGSTNGDDDDQDGLDSGNNNSTSIDTGDDTLDSGNNSTSIDTEDETDINSDNSTAASTSSADASATATATSSSAPLASVTKAADASLGGSFTISGGLDLSASATGTFFGLFDASKKLTLFKKSFPLFSKTFGGEDGEAGGEADNDAGAESDSDSSDGDSDTDTTDADTDSDDADSRRALRVRNPFRFRTHRVPRAQRFALYARGLSCIADATGESKDLADETIPGKSL